jgi:hypothetical protein
MGRKRNELIEAMEREIKSVYPHAVPSRRESPRWLDETQEADACHMMWMLHEARSLPAKKAHRWIGFVQAWLWIEHDVSIDRLREITREALS